MSANPLGRRPVGRGTHLWLLLAIVASAVWLRFHDIDRQGLRFADEGTYCLFGRALYHNVPNQIGEKAGQAVLVCLSYCIFGFSMASPLKLSALLGCAAVVAMYHLGRVLYDRAAGLIAASAVACMPMWLFYHRSAMTDGNYHFCAIVGLLLVALGIRAEAKSRLFYSIAAGVPLSLAFCINPPGSLFAGCAAIGLVVACRRKGLLPVAAMTLSGIATYYAFVWSMRRYVNWGNVGDMYAWRAKWVLGFEPSLWFMRNLWAYAGPVVVLIGFAGAVLACWARRRSDLFVLTLLAGLVLFSARLRLQFPRLYLPLTVPLVLLAARLGSACLSRARGWRGFGLAGLCLVFALPGACRAQDFIRARSGYDAACRWLVADGVKKGAGTHSWWMFQTFTGRRFTFETRGLARVLRKDEPDVREAFKILADNGSTHLVLDYFLWRDVDPKVRRGLEAMLRDTPPTLTVPNPIVAYPPTSREDDAIPALEHEPLAHNIYIYRLRDYLPK